MSLRFIYGKAGTGKTTFCFNEIKNNINKKEKVFVITPEQFSYTAEKRLLEMLDTKASIHAEVISFKRMANRIFTEVGGLNNVLISKSGRAMLIYSILEKEKKNLRFLGTSNDNIDLVLKEITELKKHSISVEDLEYGIKNIGDIQLKEKIKDINNIYKLYEKYMTNNFIDEEDILTKLCEKIPESNMFDDAVIYIDEFSGFTKQEYNILKEILKKAKQVNVTVCTDNIETNTQIESDIFYFNKQFIKLLTECAQNVDKKQEKSIFLKNSLRFKNPELKHLEENIYNKTQKKYTLENNNIKLFITKTPYTEIEHIAQEISGLIKEGKYEYKDIAIITKNIDSINNIVKAIFSKYNIPIFIDEKYEITENVLIKYVLSILDIFSSNWNNEAVFSYIKSGFLDIDKEEIYRLEKYCQKMGINRNKWYKQQWKENEDIRKKIITPLLHLKEEIDKKKNAKEISKKIYEYLIKNNIKLKLNKKIYDLKNIGENQIAEEYKNSADILVEVLDEITAFFQDEIMTIDTYKEILKIGLKNKEAGKIPHAIDQVMLGDVDRTRSNKVKVVFVIGINDGIFPSVNRNEGFINDKDREILKENNLEIAKGTLENLYEEQFNIYKAFTIAEERLYLSYASSNKEGASLRPSILIAKLKRIFPNLKEESDIIEEKSVITNPNATFEETLKNIRRMKDGVQIDDVWIDIYNWYKKNEFWREKLNYCLKGLEHLNEAEIINKENISKLYGSTLKTSVSKLEQYRRCPFSFHLKYGLKVKEDEEYKINAIDTGSFMHDIVDEFFERVDDVNIIEDEEIEEIVEEIINQKLKLEKNYIFSSSSKFIVLTHRLKKTIKESIKYIVYQMKLSDFKVTGHEVEFTKNMGNIEISGKVDRIDLANNDDGEFIRIIDYKSSEKNIDLNQMIAGTQIQLMTYIDALSEQEKKQPAGILYFNLIEPIISESKNLSDEEIEEKIKKSFRMNGLILADVKVIKMMDKSLEKGASKIIPAYIDREGNISRSSSSTITKEQFVSLQKTTQKIIKQISNEILSGNIEIKPVYDKAKKTSACKYCAYKTICGFDEQVNKYSYLQHRTKEEILEDIVNNK